jgi:4-diphosphocytidyl-2-C-methyl-D-erythritol kinase
MCLVFSMSLYFNHSVTFADFASILYKRYMKLFAPAKINLYLHIEGKRDDGFHELETLMCPVDVGDEIELTLSEGIQLRVENHAGGMDVPVDANNLVHRAAVLLKEHAKTRKGVSILLRKHLPAGAGLGGGSSDAGAVLRGLNELWQTNLSVPQLQNLASQLGSDIPFFVQPQPAICTGRGEHISPIQLQKQAWVVLFYPGFGVSTVWAYKTYAQNPRQGDPGKAFYWFDPAKPIQLRNDLEPPVFSKYLWIQETKRWLQQHPLVEDALMSGSGATVLAVVEGQDQAKLLADEARERMGSAAWIQATRMTSTEKF